MNTLSEVKMKLRQENTFRQVLSKRKNLNTELAAWMSMYSRKEMAKCLVNLRMQNVWKTEKDVWSRERDCPI